MSSASHTFGVDSVVAGVLFIAAGNHFYTFACPTQFTFQGAASEGSAFEAAILDNERQRRLLARHGRFPVHTTRVLRSGGRESSTVTLDHKDLTGIEPTCGRQGAHASPHLDLAYPLHHCALSSVSLIFYPSAPVPTVVTRIVWRLPRRLGLRGTRLVSHPDVGCPRRPPRRQADDDPEDPGVH